jgi:hypothetical protein
MKVDAASEKFFFYGELPIIDESSNYKSDLYANFYSLLATSSSFFNNNVKSHFYM